MKMSREEILESLALASHAELGEVFYQLEDRELQSIWCLVQSVLQKEQAGLDSLFSVMTHTMKFIPNVLLVSLTSRYIEPPIAARISTHLTLKQSVAIANGLEVEYISESARYMPAELCADLLTKMKERKATAAFKCLKRVDTFAFKALKSELISRRVLHNFQ